MSKTRRVSISAALAAAVMLTVGTSTTAFAAPSCLSRATVLPSAQSGWSAPLDRVISVSAGDLSLREAIDRVGSESHLKLSYSSDLLPTDRRVCLSIDRMSAGTVLTELLRSTSLRAIVLDANNVALTPTRGPTASDAQSAMMNGVGQLDRVVVTGTADGEKNRSSPFALDVLDGRALSRNNSSTLSSAFDGAVPGMWMWTQSPSNMISRFGSVRGASSFGVTSPKMYIDGIEVANPLVFTQFDADRIDRVEVIRGPQGAALYGADAISGVVNIITRHDGASDNNGSWIARTRGGMSSSAFSNGAFVQDHSLGFRAGSGRRSFGVGLGVGTVGNYIPGGAEQSLLADADVRFVGSRTLWTGMTRIAAKTSGALGSPVVSSIGQTTTPYEPLNSNNKWSNLADSAQSGTMPFGDGGERADSLRRKRLKDIYGNGGVDSNATQSLVQYTVGTTGTWTASPRWTHTLVAGVDGYRLNGISSQGMSVPVALDSVDRLAHTEADRTTLAIHSTARLGSEDGLASSFIVGAEHTATRQEIQSRDDIAAGSLSISAKSPENVLSFWSNTAGLLSQINSSWRNSLFLSAGGRAEYSSGAAADSRVSLLPMLGAAWVKEKDGQTLKFRAAYGKGIRPSNSVARAATWMSSLTQYGEAGHSARLALESLRNLAPEAQAGTELGVDVLFGNALGIHATRFDQRATGLIQAVALPSQVTVGANNNITYELQNVGAITNRGWELQASSLLGPFALQGSASFVDSRVQQVASGYGGELRPGDRMLEVPAQTFGVGASYTTSRWSTTLSLSRAMNWINYDQLAIAERQASAGFEPKSVTGAYLRNYWREYSGANRLRSTISYSLRRGLSLLVTGDNLLNLQRGEPDNVTVVPGRTLTLGIRTRF